MRAIEPHLLAAAERILGSERHKLGKDTDFVRAVAVAYGTLGNGSTNDQILRHAEAVFAGMQANAAPIASNQPTSGLALEEARLQGEQNGTTAERNRIRAILTDPLAENRMEAAKHLAFGTDMRASEALALLFTVKPGGKAETLQSLPSHIARTCNAPGGLVAFDASAGTIATVEAGGATGGASVGFAPAPDPFVKADPNARNRAAWKRTTDALNAEGAQATIHG
ncbi:hypothetical protein [Pseudochrobactrum sp. B5]|uniref:hypothetical protein n=1 Tax=Pseudochrobactrum sp. B5 TaxID=1289478 RepID=UPI000952A1D2|nr:hypothetical protein [Pseudochrobactrum sp. B5]